MLCLEHSFSKALRESEQKYDTWEILKRADEYQSDSMKNEDTKEMNALHTTKVIHIKLNFLPEYTLPTPQVFTRSRELPGYQHH